MKLARQEITGAVICGSIAAAPFVISWIQVGTKAFFAGLMWGTSAPAIGLYFTFFCAAVGTNLKISMQQAKGCLIGALVASAPFAFLWILIGTKSFVYGEIGKAPPVAIALIVTLCCAALCATLRKR